jgi:hypothetical protein
MRPTIRVALLFAAACAVFSEAVSAQAYAIPPGREEQLLDLLGGGDALADGCHLENAQVERVAVHASYRCDGGIVERLDLRHPSQASEAIRTERFELVASAPGSASQALLSGVAARIRTREATWQWIVVSTPTGRPRPALTATRVAFVAAQCAWGLFLLAALVLVFRLARQHPHDAALALALLIASLVLRLALPHGPLDFAEAERTEAFWAREPRAMPGFITLDALGASLRALGVSVGGVVRFVGPVLGAVGVAAVYVLARALGSTRMASVLAAVVLSLWPAHARYSATEGLAVVGPTLWTVSLALSAATTLSPWRRWPMLVPTAVLVALSRPEFPVAVASLVPFAVAPNWTRRERVFAMFALAVVAALYLAAIGAQPGDRHGLSASWMGFVPRAFVRASVAPVWLLPIGFAGLAVGPIDRRARRSLAFAAIAFAAVYAVHASEDNPLFGEWRYALPLVVPVVSGVAALFDRWGRERSLSLRLAACAGLCAASLVNVPALMRRTDAQTEFAYVRESAPRVTQRFGRLLVVAGDSAIASELLPTLALATRLGPLDRPARASHEFVSGQVALALLPDTVDAIRSLGDLEHTAVYLGIHIDQATRALARAGVRFVPIEERTLRVAPAMRHVDTVCDAPNVFVGLALNDCDARVGWYRLALAP